MTITSFTRYTVPQANRILGVDGWVYFARCAALGVLKIGWSQDPAHRLEQLRCGIPHPLEMITARAGSKADEKALHHRYRDLRVSGEWFRYAPRLQLLVWRTLKKNGPTPWPAPLKRTKEEAALDRLVSNGKASYVPWTEPVEHHHLFGGRNGG